MFSRTENALLLETINRFLKGRMAYCYEVNELSSLLSVTAEQISIQGDAIAVRVNSGIERFNLTKMWGAIASKNLGFATIVILYREDQLYLPLRSDIFKPSDFAEECLNGIERLLCQGS